MIHPELLLAFQAVVDCGGFTRAAERLHRTQSTISMQIKRLEESLGCRLLNRQGVGVALTADGERLLGRVRRLLALHDEIVAEFTGTQPAGHVRIGTPADYAAAYLGDLLPFLIRRFPAVTVEVESDLSRALMSRFEEGQLDLVIITRMRGFVAGHTLRRTPMVWVSAPGATALDRRPLPVAVFPSGCYWRDEALKALEAADIDYRIVYQSPGIAGIEAAVRADFAVAALVSGTFSSQLAVLTGSALPPLPPIEIALYVGDDAREPITSLADYLVSNLGNASRVADTVA